MVGSEGQTKPITVGDALRELPPADLADLADRSPRAAKEAIARALDIRVPSGRVRGGFGRLVASRTRSLHPQLASLVADLLTGPMFDEGRELLGQDAFDDPEPADLDRLVDDLLSRWSVAQVTFALRLAVVAESKAADQVRVLLESDARLAPGSSSTADSGTEHSGDTSSEEETSSPDADGVTQTEDDAALFSVLDRLLIQTAVASVAQQEGAPTLDELTQLVGEVAALNASRRSSHFHVGFVEGLTGRVVDVPEPVMNAERRSWRMAGLVHGFVRRNSTADIEQLLVGSRSDVLALLGDGPLGAAVTAPLVVADLSARGAAAADLIRSRSHPFPGMEDTFWLVYRTGRHLLFEGRPTDAQALFEALRHWLPGLASPLDGAATLHRRLAACRRALGDFVGATRVLDAVEPELDSGPFGISDAAASLALERGLIASSVRLLSDLRFPESEERAVALLENLERGQGCYERAHELDPTQPQAAYCLGLLATCAADLERSVTMLEIAESAIRRDPVFEQSGLAQEVRLHHAVQRLQMDPLGASDRSLASMREAWQSGVRPPRHTIDEALRALDDADAPALVPFISELAERGSLPDRGVSAVEERARRGDPSAVELALRLSRRTRFGPVKRLDLLLAALSGLGDAADGEVDEVIDRIEEIVAGTTDDAVEQRWQVALGADPGLRALLTEPVADQLRADSLHRTGNTAEAVEVLRNLLLRSARTSLAGVDPSALLERLEELDAPDSVIATCRAAMPSSAPEEQAQAQVAEPLVVLFVGGNETQEAYDDAVRAAIADAYGGKVTVEFFHPGWSSNWSKHADAVEARYAEADAVVIMQLVRTTFGQRIRRTAGEAGLPWVPCVAHGRAGIERSIHDAVRAARTSAGS